MSESDADQGGGSSDVEETVLVPGVVCPKCAHRHRGPDLAGICVGCPCPVVARWPRAPGIPEWFGEYEMPDGREGRFLKALEIDGRWWVTNGKAMLLRAERPAELEVMPPQAVDEARRIVETKTRPTTRSFPYAPQDFGGDDLMDFVCTIGDARIMFYLVSLVERLHPGCFWRTGLGWPAPAFAVHGGRVVAVVMPTATPAEAEVQAPGSRLSFAGAIAAVSLLAYGNRARMTDAQIREHADRLGHLLGEIAAASVDETEAPLAEAVRKKIGLET